ncbi:hypothetical protein [Acidocella sp. MX-AZ02]|uniref:hypothetical protein n=1 Tax=Acidocella sp. MX-AZ02 TaxID=1214225 RepID=UPI001F094001|nr:hypothetical protein [Acidocella sp. MX-AZ02]
MPNTARLSPHPDLQRIDDGAGTGLDAAAKRRQHREIGIRRHLHHIALMRHHMAGKAGLAEEMAVHRA